MTSSSNLPTSEFSKMLVNRWSQGKVVCVGLDSDFNKIPQFIKDKYGSQSILQVIMEFNKKIIDASLDLVCAYKPNIAFYEAFGQVGIEALQKTVKYIKESDASIPVILDAKRADIGSTNQGYVQFAFDKLEVDAITVHSYLGCEAMQPFLDRKEKGIIVLVKTSNQGSGEFQDLLVGDNQEPLYLIIARNVVNHWNRNGNCAVVVGATYPKELAKVREIVGDMHILIPGIGIQGGDFEQTVKAGKDSKGMGMIISASRSIIFASNGLDFADSARIEIEKVTGQLKQIL